MPIPPAIRIIVELDYAELNLFDPPILRFHLTHLQFLYLDIDSFKFQWHHHVEVRHGLRILKGFVGWDFIQAFAEWGQPYFMNFWKDEGFSVIAPEKDACLWILK